MPQDDGSSSPNMRSKLRKQIMLFSCAMMPSEKAALGPVAAGSGCSVLPATGSVIALITAATNRRPYVVGKPNPMMFRSAMNRIKAHSETTAMIGDRMDTDIVAGIEAGLFTVLVLTGITGRKDLERFPYRPNLVVESAAALRKML